MKTYFPKENDDNWVIVDAEGQTVGRLATKIATVLKGKHKRTYTPNMLCGDFVVVINAEKALFSGDKINQKVYTRYSGYQGGLKRIPASTMMETFPERVIEHAVWGMLPKNRLGRKIIRRMKVYAGSEHPHAAQQPKEMSL